MRLLPRDRLYALPEREREAVRALEWHVGFRAAARKHAPIELEEDGQPTTFLTVGHFARCLTACGATRTGRDFAAECLKEILPRLGLIEDTGRVWKPKLSGEEQARRETFGHGSPHEGGQRAQPSILRSRWWRVFRLPTLPRLVESLFGSWLQGGVDRSRQGEASLSRLFRCQDLFPPNRRRRSFVRGSVQWVFRNTGPP